jgi:hypothetical protein
MQKPRLADARQRVLKLNACVARLVPAIALFGVATAASAATVAETASKWGLMGRWSVDCRIPPDHDRGAVLSYQIRDRNKLVLHRDFGDSEDEAEVIAADISGDNRLDLRIYFPQLRQTRELGLMRLPDGAIRAVYNRMRGGAYSIKDGRIMANGQPTPGQFRCGD